MDTNFVKVAPADSVPENSMKTFKVAGKKIMIANAGGQYYAIGAICKHEEWDLADGELMIDSKKVVCPGHGAIWSLIDGSVEFDEALPNEPIYEVKLENNEIYVNPQPK